MVIGAGVGRTRPGVRIVGKTHLEDGQKITVALGQKGNRKCGAGGTFVVVNNKNESPDPLFVAAGAGYAYDRAFSKGQFTQEASGNEDVGSSGIQQLMFENDDIFCAGAGFIEEPEYRGDDLSTIPPQCYPQGLIGGKGYGGTGYENLEGGFGGGGACYQITHASADEDPFGVEERNVCFGAGGGYTGGGTQISNRRRRNTRICVGGGGGSFSIDPDAKFDHFYTEYGKCKIQLIS